METSPLTSRCLPSSHRRRDAQKSACAQAVASTLPISPSVVSEARRGKEQARARCVRVLSIQRLEGGRWRLRWMRLMAGPGLTAMGIESFLVYNLLILHGLGKSEQSENRS